MKTKKEIMEMIELYKLQLNTARDNSDEKEYQRVRSMITILEWVIRE